MKWSPICLKAKTAQLSHFLHKVLFRSFYCVYLRPMAFDEQNNSASKRKIRKLRADGGQVRERMAFGLAMLTLWGLGLWFVLTH